MKDMMLPKGFTEAELYDAVRHVVNSEAFLADTLNHFVEKAKVSGETIAEANAVLEFRSDCDDIIFVAVQLVLGTDETYLTGVVCIGEIKRISTDEFLDHYPTLEVVKDYE